MTTEMLNELAEDGVPNLTSIFTTSIETGRIPHKWHLVAHIFKKGDRNNAANYMPVLLTSNCCKVDEGGG